jgi:hypothetical protein
VFRLGGELTGAPGIEGHLLDDVVSRRFANHVTPL